MFVYQGWLVRDTYLSFKKEKRKKQTNKQTKQTKSRDHSEAMKNARAWIAVIIKVKGTSHDFIFQFLSTLADVFAVSRPPVYYTYPPKKSCRNDIFNARKPNNCSLN